MLTPAVLRNSCAAATLVVLSILCGGTTAAQDADRVDVPDFQRRILPLLADRCFSCHGPDESANASGLRLDVADQLFDELPSGDGYAVVAGEPARSELIRRIRNDDSDLVMPPPGSNRHPISQQELADLTAWIEAGAKFERHWSFEPLPAEVSVPNVGDSPWPNNDIDRFVLAELQRRGASPNPPAQRWRWLRRVTLDLTGLPPTLAELDAFENDTAADAYEKVVDRLLASPRFGEHMAVGWLDIARYADSYGYQSDLLCQVWPYRDWVVNAYNSNMPYDQFVREQLAGDLLADATTSQRVATAFNRLHRQTNEGGSIDLEWRTEYAADRVQTMSTAFLGLTLECARCHDHKFDPISTRDYYQLMAFFNSIDEAGTYNDAIHIPTPTQLLPNKGQSQQLAAIEIEIEELIRERADSQARSAGAFTRWLAEAQPIAMPQPWCRYKLDERSADNKFVDEVDSSRMATTASANVSIPDRNGLALRFSGDDALNLPCFELKPWQPFTVCCWLKIPADISQAMIWHQTTGTDTGFSGTELTLVDRKLRLSAVRFWPGNAISIESLREFPVDSWCFVAATYDGSGTAAGLVLYVDSDIDTRVLRNELTKSPSSGTQLGFGERFRTRGPQGGAIDEVCLFDECLSAIEIRMLRDGRAIAPEDSDEFRRHFAARVDPQLTEYDARCRELIKQRFSILDQVQELMVMRESAQSTETFVLERGAYDAPRTPQHRVDRDTPHALPRMPADAPRNRLGLAQWLTQADHPLTSRVAVNRLWQHFYGAGLVATAEDFGVQGARPTHPQLLDWLARDLVKHAWDIKRCCRQIVLSATYRQDSRLELQKRELDPSNIWLSGGSARRMSAEMLRDSALWQSGLLVDRLGGPPVSPYQPDGLWTENNSFSPPYQVSDGEGLHRRSLYSVWKRTAPLPNMIAFDAGAREVCVARRTVTNSPIQSLVLLNDPQFVEAAIAAAKLALQQAFATDADRLDWLFRRATARRLSAEERNILTSLLAEQREFYLQHSQAAAELLGLDAVESQPDGESIEEVAAWAVTVQAIMNCDAAVWRR